MEKLLLIKLMIIALTLYGSIALHELGHFCTFKINGIPMRMLNVGCVSFIFNGSKWVSTLNRNTANIVGIAIPNLSVISNEKEFRKIQRAYGRAILGGPLASLLLIGIGALLTGRPSYIFGLGIWLIVINAGILLSCFVKTDGVCGDFLAYKAYKNDDFFAALMMYQYALFAVDYEKTRKNNIYLRNLLLKNLEARVHNRQVDLLTISAVSTLINDYLIGIIHEIPERVKDYIDYYYENYRVIMRTKKSETNKQLLLRLAYYYKKIGLEENATNIYKDFIKKLPRSEVFHYWKIQSEQIIMGKDHSTYLLDHKNIKACLAYGVFHKLEGFYHDELILNQPMK